MEIGGQNSNNSSNINNVTKWSPYIWGWGDLNSSSTILEFDNTDSIYETDTTAAATATTEANTSLGHEAMWLPPGSSDDYHSLYGGDGPHVHPDPHLMCLKLGKRHYFEDAAAAAPTVAAAAAAGHLGERHVLMGAAGKGGKPSCLYGSAGGASASSSTPRCQVEGCHVALGNAKEYHRRHKVCEMHSKAPKVFVFGFEQRFCQQCSRFHAVSEFDDSKRSCRRRLAGHNERRRKSFNDSIPRNSPQYDDRSMEARIFPYIPSSPTGRALSLLSSDYSNNWATSQSQIWPTSPPDDLSSRSSAALRELIAENRAATAFIHSKQLQEWVPHSNNQGLMEFNNDHDQPEMYHSTMYPCHQVWDRKLP